MTEQAMFGAGCFWGVEASFSKLPGLLQTAVGYSGGKTDQPTYKQVCAGTTGHAEVLWLEFDPSVITYQKLVTHFFGMHDPTQVDRQGPDFGTQYRSMIYYYSDAQRQTAEAVKAEAARKHARPIATRIEPTQMFWRAEEYHQKYFEKHGGGGCHV